MPTMTPADLKQLADEHISEPQLSSQLDRFKKGFQPLTLSAAATVGSGILRLSESEIQTLITSYEKSTAQTLKFVPASGAASRMFKAMFALLDLSGAEIQQDETAVNFFGNLKDFAFFDDLKARYEAKHAESIEHAMQRKDKSVVQALLQEKGLSYSSLPKGLLKFHKYEDGAKTPVQEHLTEGVAYASQQGQVKIHFTVSPEHQEKFEAHVSEVTSSYQKDLQIEVSYSTQQPSTNTVAVDLENELFRDDQGRLVFRPAGHGALLANLNQLDADIVFIKNIDNVVPDRIKDQTIRFKKVLAGLLLSFQQKSFELLAKADQGESILIEAKELLSQMGLKGDIAEEEAREKLNRPIRVCGMVKNEGEPGGGPFWVKKGDHETLQIVESAQVDISDPNQKAIFIESTHFNPVDLVCSMKDYTGAPFDLLKHRDEDTGFITEKSYQGRKLRAMELPGLWNGSMANWNTIFVEVPLITFNPVKTVMDLLKQNHQ